MRSGCVLTHWYPEKRPQEAAQRLGGMLLHRGDPRVMATAGREARRDAQPLDCEKCCWVTLFSNTQGLFAKQPLAGEC